MKVRSPAYELSRSLRVNVSNHHLAGEVELALLALMLRVKVSGLMFLVEHADDDSEEDSDDRHVRV